MAKIPVTDCPAGPALDAAVARAEGYEVLFDKNGLPYYADMVIAGTIIGYVRKPSADIADAWRLVSQMTKEFRLDFMTSKYNHSPERDRIEWGVFVISYDTSFTGYGSTAPLAITRAFLLAEGVEFVEVDEAV